MSQNIKYGIDTTMKFKDVLNWKDVWTWKKKLTIFGIIMVLPAGMLLATICFVIFTLWFTFCKVVHSILWVVVVFIVTSFLRLMYVASNRTTWKELPGEIWDELADDWDLFKHLLDEV